EEPIALVLVHGYAPRGVQRVGGPGGRAANGAHAVIPATGLQRISSLALRVIAARHDETGQCIGAITRALRTAQHLDLAHVEQRGRHAKAAEIDVIDQEAHGRIRRALVLLTLADAADLEIA